MTTQPGRLFDEFRDSAWQTIIYGVGFSIRQGAVFLLTPIYTRRLSTEEYATMSLAVLLGNLVGQFARAGIEQALFRSYYDYDDQERRRVVVSNALFLTLVLTTVILGATYLMALPIAALFLRDRELARFLHIVLGAAFFSNMTYVPLAVFRLRMQPGRYSAVSLLAFLMQLGSTIYLVLGKGRGVEGVLLANLLTATANAALMIFLIRDCLVFQISGREIGKLLSFGAPYAPAGFLNKIMDSGDRYIMQFMGLTAMVGVYTLGYTVGQSVQVFITVPLGLMLTPVIFGMEKHPQAKKFYAHLPIYVAIAGIGFALGVSVVAKELVQIIALSEYASAWRVVPILSLAFAIIALRLTVSVGLSLKRKTIFFLLNRIIAVLLKLLLSYWWIPWWGMMGASVAQLIAEALAFTFILAISQRYYWVDYQWRRLGHISLAALAVYSLSTLIHIDNPWVSIVTKLLIWMLYPILMIVTGLLTVEEKRRLGEIWRFSMLPRLESNSLMNQARQLLSGSGD